MEMERAFFDPLIGEEWQPMGGLSPFSDLTGR